MAAQEDGDPIPLRGSPATGALVAMDGFAALREREDRGTDRDDDDDELSGGDDDDIDAREQRDRDPLLAAEAARGGEPESVRSRRRVENQEAGGSLYL